MMKKKEAIRILIIHGILFYNLSDATKVLFYSSLEAALRNVSAESVVCIASIKSCTILGSRSPIAIFIGR